jgi:hypothetical protein
MPIRRLKNQLFLSRYHRNASFLWGYRNVEKENRVGQKHLVKGERASQGSVLVDAH